MNNSERPWQWLTDYLRHSIKPDSGRRVGVEIERIGMWEDGLPLRYASTTTHRGEHRPGAEQLLTQLHEKHQWPLVKNDQGLPLGLASPFGKVSLEPGSQLEFSADPAIDLVSLQQNVHTFEKFVREITDPWELKWLGIGVNPFSRVEDIDVIPSTRYRIMTDYLGRAGKLGTSMMRLTSSIQINLDFESEAEGIEMLKAALAATPISYALFANSPLLHGKQTGHLAYRNIIWQNTDFHRTGLLSEAFQPGFDFDRYAELAWKRPLMFAQDISGRYVETDGLSLFEINNKHSPMIKPDEHNQLNTIRELFFEARLKPGYVEVRSIDGLKASDRYAAIAFWLGLLYSKDARDIVLDHFGKLTPKERDMLLKASVDQGMKSKWANCSLRDWGKELLQASRTTLKARNFGEEVFLEPLESALDDGENPAQHVLRRWRESSSAQPASLIRYLET